MHQETSQRRRHQQQSQSKFRHSDTMGSLASAVANTSATGSGRTATMTRKASPSRRCFVDGTVSVSESMASHVVSGLPPDEIQRESCRERSLGPVFCPGSEEIAAKICLERTLGEHTGHRTSNYAVNHRNSSTSLTLENRRPSRWRLTLHYVFFCPQHAVRIVHAARLHGRTSSLLVSPGFANFIELVCGEVACVRGELANEVVRNLSMSPPKVR